MSENSNFWHLIPLNPRIKIFFHNISSVTFFTLLTPNFMQSFRKTNEQSPRSLKTDQRTDRRTMDGPGRLLRTPSGKPWDEIGNILKAIMEMIKNQNYKRF